MLTASSATQNSARQISRLCGRSGDAGAAAASSVAEAGFGGLEASEVIWSTLWHVMRFSIRVAPLALKSLNHRQMAFNR